MNDLAGRAGESGAPNQFEEPTFQRTVATAVGQDLVHPSSAGATWRTNGFEPPLEERDRGETSPARFIEGVRE